MLALEHEEHCVRATAAIRLRMKVFSFMIGFPQKLVVCGSPAGNRPYIVCVQGSLGMLGMIGYLYRNF